MNNEVRKLGNFSISGEFPELLIDEKKKQDCQERLQKAYRQLYEGTGEGKEMRGWLEWPKKYLQSDEYVRLKATAKKIQNENDAVIVIGIGGSYLTPKMIISSEYGDEYNQLAPKNNLPQIYFAGCDLSPDKLNQTIELVSEKSWSIIYISKSGGTMEPALAFRILWKKLYDKYGDTADQRVYAVTDAEKGTLKELVNEHGWESFIIPDDIGGRYSGLTACGLLPVEVAGIDTEKLLKGAIDANVCIANEPNCFALNYAKYRYINYMHNQCSVEFFATNTPWLSYAAEWLKQLFGESEGKDKKGLFPTSGVFPTDLHSLGQYLQDGLEYLIMETFIIREFNTDIEIPTVKLNDNLDNRAGKKFSQAAAAAMDGAYKAHSSGGRHCAIIRVNNTLESLGYLMQSMFVACALSAYLINVNPFNQPGVEAHKANMKISPEWDK